LHEVYRHGAVGALMRIKHRLPAMPWTMGKNAGSGLAIHNADCYSLSYEIEEPGMAHLGSSVEYGVHCLLWLVSPQAASVSSRDLAELQGISPSFVAKIFQKLEKAGIVSASEGIRGGYRLARAADKVTVLDVIDAVEGPKPIFECQEIRGRCAVFGGEAPSWAIGGTCAVHAVMLRAEKSMRAELAKTTLADLSETVNRKVPGHFAEAVQGWLGDRVLAKSEARAEAVAAARSGEGATGNGSTGKGKTGKGKTGKRSP
jgi:Rrf2 family protein